jgi:hypothetical protein
LFKQLKVTKEEILKKYPNYVSQQKPAEPASTSVSANQKFKPVQPEQLNNPESPNTDGSNKENGSKRFDD